MIHLDDLDTLRALDQENYLERLRAFPNDLETAFEKGRHFSMLPLENLRGVVLAGMGGSASGADLAAAWAEPLCPAPLTVLRGYDLPGWASGPEVLVVVFSYSGATEEMLSVFRQGVTRGCSMVAVTTGGELACLAGEAGAECWRYEHPGPARAALGWTLGYNLALLARLALADPAAELAEALSVMRSQAVELDPQSPLWRNPAKRQAGQMMGRWAAIFGSDGLAASARRMKTQVNELAKAWAQAETLPEADHNTAAGLEQPPEMLAHTFTLFLSGTTDHLRNQLRAEATRELFLQAGLNTDVYQAHGQGRLAQMLSAVQFGDFTAYYLALAYGMDPTPVEGIHALKLRFT
jgi:glucose/mannose-6-phosphate isomerase